MCNKTVPSGNRLIDLSPVTAEAMVVKDPKRMEFLRQQAEKMKAKYPGSGRSEEIPAAEVSA
jgi:hypothetical protein